MGAARTKVACLGVALAGCYLATGGDGDASLETRSGDASAPIDAALTLTLDGDRATEDAAVTRIDAPRPDAPRPVRAPGTVCGTAVVSPPGMVGPAIARTATGVAVGWTRLPDDGSSGSIDVGTFDASTGSQIGALGALPGTSRELGHRLVADGADGAHVLSHEWTLPPATFGAEVFLQIADGSRSRSLVTDHTEGGAHAAARADELAIVWAGPRGLELARYAVRGERLEAHILGIGTEEAAAPFLVATADGWAVVWIDRGEPLSGFPTHGVFFAALDTGGLVRAGPTQVSRAEDGLNGFWPPSMAWTGSELGITWSRAAGRRHFFFRRVSPRGLPLDDELRLSWSEDEGGIFAQIVWDDSLGYGLIRLVDHDGTARFTRLDPDGTPFGRDVVLGSSAHFGIVALGGAFGVVWEPVDASGIVYARICP